jgi:hypothetical protein
MSTTTERHPATRGRPARGIVTGLSLALGGLAFIAGGATHPSDNGQGNKVVQLHDMLVDGAWYPAHGLLLASMVLFAAGIVGLRGRAHPDSATARTLRVVAVVAVVGVVGMTVHLFEAVNADSLADGQANVYSVLQTLNEILVDATWGLALAALAVVGGITGTLGNRVTLVLGLVGGGCFTLASATIPFTDRFDAVFPVASLLGLWAVVVGVIELRRPDRGQRRAAT